MDPRVHDLLTRQQAARFAGLSGSDVRAALRISTALLNEAIVTYTQSAPAIRELTVTPRAGNRFDVHLRLAKALIPAINATVLIERQPQLPADPVLVLQVTGIGTLLRFAGPAINAFAGALPPGLRMDGDRVLIDMRAALRVYGQAELFDLAEELAVGTDEGHAIVVVHARVP